MKKSHVAPAGLRGARWGSGGASKLQPIYNVRGWSNWPHRAGSPRAPPEPPAPQRLKAEVVESKRKHGTTTVQCLELESTGACTYKNLPREFIGVSGRPVFSLNWSFKPRFA